MEKEMLGIIGLILLWIVIVIAGLFTLGCLMEGYRALRRINEEAAVKVTEVVNL